MLHKEEEGLEVEEEEVEVEEGVEVEEVKIAMMNLSLRTPMI